MLSSKHTFLLKVILTIITVSYSLLSYSQKLSEAQIEKKIDSLVSIMSLDEKIGQTAQRGKSSRIKDIPEPLKEAVKRGAVGSMLNITNRDDVDDLQQIAVKESPHGIPILFGRDVIHGYKTIFPIPLGQAATWNPDVVEQGASIAAEESSTNGIRWTFAPMVDISRDPRWGRIAESSGEDPYLTSIMAKAAVKGFQGSNMSASNKIAACAKHYVGYGAAEGGRDYNSAIIAENILRDVYLKPFKATVDAGVATFMSSFNDLNGVPASGNKFTLKTILRDEWKYDGLVVSDWNSITEMIAHGYCADAKEAAQKAANAGLDMEMMSTAYEDNLKTLIQEGKFSEAQLDDFVKNILRIKYRLGLFEKPYVDRSRDKNILSQYHREAAKNAAIQSIVLLQNNNHILPLTKGKASVAIIGPLANSPHEQLGTWIFDGEAKDAVTPLTSLHTLLGANALFTPGLTYSRDRKIDGFAEALATAQKSDVILFFGGEESILSGEAHSRADISLPGKQEELIKELKKTGKPIVLIIMAGRPISINNIIDDVDALLMAWHPGTMAGPAITDVLFGISNPSGKLPITWPKVAAQAPLYYNHFNTGRPADPKTFVQQDSIPIGAWQSSLGNNSHYLDIGYQPQFPFGYGLSYTSFAYNDIKLSSSKVKSGETITITATLTNAGKLKGTEIVQLYVRDLVGDVVRPVRELKGFKRVTLEPGQKKEVTFNLSTSELSFYNQEMKQVTEPGFFHVWIGGDSNASLMAEFEVVK